MRQTQIEPQFVQYRIGLRQDGHALSLTEQVNFQHMGGTEQ